MGVVEVLHRCLITLSSVIGDSCHGDGNIESVVTRKEHQCCVRGKISPVVLLSILGEGVARISRTWRVGCGGDVVCTFNGMLTEAANCHYCEY